MTRALLTLTSLLLACLLASCARDSQQPHEATPDGAEAATPETEARDAASTPAHARSSAATEQPSESFFVGRWATAPENCAEASWTFTPQGLRTAGHVTCDFQRVTPTARGAEIEAICVAEAAPAPYKIQFRRGQSARQMHVDHAPFADADLVRCDEAPSAPVSPPAPGTPGGLPDDRTPVSEAPFTPTSAQGAANVVQTYYALLGEHRYADAWKLWTQGGQGSGMSAEAFAASFAQYESYNANIGAPGQIEGAAGSLYVSVPVVIYGRRKTGEEVHQLGEATLRRVNDVPGSTAEQRAWHLFKIDLKPSPGPAAR